MTEFSNSDKSIHGRSAQGSLAGILHRCIDKGYIIQVTSDYRIGKEGYANDKQFYAPFLIVFEDESKWAIFSTTSLRTDRVKGQQWDALNLKEIDPLIVKVYLVYPDGLSQKDRDLFLKQNEKYVNRIEYSEIDAVVSQDEIVNLIEDYALRNKTQGQKKDIQGNSFESRVADVLSFKTNLEKWKNDDDTIEGMHFEIFKSIVNCFGINKEKTESISATCDKKVIGRLPSGGNPKTDVLAEVINLDGSSQKYTISCKRSSEKSVSVHQYNADAFADVLDKDNPRLRRLLQYFQACGSKEKFGEENSNELEKELSPYVEKLSMWVLGGQGGDGNPLTQNAEYILTYDNNGKNATIHRVEDYCHMLIESNVTGFFGTPFSWTYPSKRRGKDIQLKCKILK